MNNKSYPHPWSFPDYPLTLPPTLTPAYPMLPFHLHPYSFSLWSLLYPTAIPTSFHLHSIANSNPPLPLLLSIPPSPYSNPLTAYTTHSYVLYHQLNSNPLYPTPILACLLIPTSSLSLYSIASKLRDWILNFSFYCLISILYKEVFTRKIIMLLGGIFLKIILGGGLMRNWWVSEKKKLNVQWQCQKKLISSCPGGTLKLLHTFFF